ncbi:MAG: hypothetical protein MUO77_13665 [Anaerolineales bacterium]|nr:hypothetical protein [Anaerolineales bacterium]
MSKHLKLTIRFYPGQDDDLIAWLEEMRTSYGKKGETVKDVLRKGLGATGSGSAVQLDMGSLMADIRQMMEAALASYAFQPAVQAEAKSQDDDLAEERLSRLDLSLSLEPPKPQPKTWAEL